MLKKIRIILLSRFKNKEETQEVRDRRLTCLECEHNSLNATSQSWFHLFMTASSSLLSLITFRSEEEGSFGYCNLCGCDIFFKSLELEDEDCVHPDGSKWKVHLKIREERKNGNKKSN